MSGQEAKEAMVGRKATIDLTNLIGFNRLGGKAMLIAILIVNVLILVVVVHARMCASLEFVELNVRHRVTQDILVAIHSVDRHPDELTILQNKCFDDNWRIYDARMGLNPLRYQGRAVDQYGVRI